MKKKLLSLALVFLLLMGLVPLAAQAKGNLKVELNKEVRFEDIWGFVPAFTIQNISGIDIPITIEVYDQATRQNVQTMSVNLVTGDAPTTVFAYVYKQLGYNGETNNYRYTISSGDYKERYYYTQKLTLVKNQAGELVKIYDQILNTYYGNNTVSSFGPHFRDVTPGKTDKWYMFSPIDLSLQGRQTFPLVASNMYEVGEAYVDVSGDNVTVSYRMFYDGDSGFTSKVKSEFVTFYKSYADVGIVEPEQMPGPSAFAFNRPFSISKDLSGDTNVLMFIRNRLDYYRFPTPKGEYTRFYENKDEYKARRDGMLRMMD